MGYYGALSFLGVDSIKLVTKEQLPYINADDTYIFPCKDCYITCPKFIYNNCFVTQSAVYTIHTVLNSSKEINYNNIFSNNVWIKSLGGEFASKDIDTVYKLTLIAILRWIMYEFNALRNKDNLDVSIKKVRYAEYIAALYADKLARGIFRLSDKADKATLNDVRRAVQIAPMYLLNAITRCQLVTYKGCANDLDSLFALKYTYKGVSGIGEKSNAIPASYRQIHPSHLGRVDLDSSSPSDPGVSGTLCPLSTLHNSYFKEFEEPNTWQESRCKMINQYRAMQSKVTMCRIVDMVKNNNEVVVNNTPSNNLLLDCVNIYGNMINYCSYVDNQSMFINGIDIFGDGIMYLTMED